MSVLPSGGHRYLERDADSAPAITPMVLRRTSSVGGVDTYEFMSTGVPDLELADITGTGVFETIAVGTSLSAPRAQARRVGGTNVLIY